MYFIAAIPYYFSETSSVPYEPSANVVAEQSAIRAVGIHDSFELVSSKFSLKFCERVITDIVVENNTNFWELFILNID